MESKKLIFRNPKIEFLPQGVPLRQTDIIKGGVAVKEIFKGRSFKILIAVLLVLLGVMMYAASRSTEQSFAASLASYITRPIQKLSALVSSGIGGFTDQFEDIDEVRAENELLEKKCRELEAQMVDYDSIKAENEELRAISGISERNSDYTFEMATVISRDSTDTFNTFIIDKGTRHGVALYDPVITADGLVGYISQIGPISSKVTTIIDSASSVGAVDSSTRDGGVLIGDLELASQGYAKLAYLARDCDVTTGDIVVTSGLGGIFPKNLIIGEVVEIKPEPQDISLYAIIEPAADISGCTTVFVITDFDGQGAVVDGELNLFPDEEPED